jgi:methionyl-tRNA formyltransferase
MKTDFISNREFTSFGKITLFIMTEKGFYFLKEVSNRYKSLIYMVVVGRDSSIEKDYAAEIIDLCGKEGLDYIERINFKDIKSEYVMTVSWRWLIDHPADKIIVFHDSLLPNYRGFSPLVNSLIQGETEIGVTALFGADKFDSGDIIVQFCSKINYPIKISEAIKINNTNYLKCALFVFDKLLASQKITGTPQNEMNASYSLWRDEMDYKIDWKKSAASIVRFIDAVGFPYKGAFAVIDGKIIRIFHAQEVPDVKIIDRQFGKVLFVSDGMPVIICGTGLLKIMDAHFDDKKNKNPFLPLSKFRLRFSDDF